MKNLLALIFWVISLTACSQAPVAHYVKTGGNDNADGLSPATAWATLTKVNNHVFIPGDSILFRRGDTWVVSNTNGSDELLIEKSSGIAGKQIVYGAFGDGAKPIITGRQSVAGWNVAANWTNTGTNIWSMPTNIVSNVYGVYNRGRLWLNGNEVQKGNNTTVPIATRPWTHNGQTLYIYCTSNPATFFTNIESVGVTNGVMLCTKDYITVQNIDFRGSGNVVQLIGSNYSIIENCSIGWDCGTSGLIGIGKGGTPPTSNNVIIRNNVFDTNDHIMDDFSFNNTEEGIYVRDGCHNWDIYGNTIKDWSHTNFNIQLDDPAYPITGTKFHGNFSTCPNVDYGRGFTYNIIRSGVGLCTGNEIYDNYFYDHPTNSQISGDGLKFYDNIIDKTRGSSYRLDFASNGLAINSYYGNAINNEIYNNIIMNARDNGIHIQYTTNLTQGNLIRNNIVVNNNLYQLRYEWSPNYILNNTFQNNLFFKSGTTQLIYYEKDRNPGAQAMSVQVFNNHNGFDNDLITGNISGDPKFIGGTTFDYHVRDSSIVLGAGINVGLKLDYEGRPWPSTHPNLGVYSTNSTTDTLKPPPDSLFHVNIYPNPATSFITVVLNSTTSLTYLIRIVSFSGKIIMEDILGTGSLYLTIPIHLSSGIYIVEILSGKLIVHTQRLIVI